MKTTKKPSEKPGSDGHQPAKPTDLEVEELQGPVKEMKYSSYKARYKKGEISCGKPLEKTYGRINYLVRFNEKGAKIEEQTIENNAVKYHNFYNEFGKEAELIAFHDTGEINFTSKSTYNDKGLLLETIVYKADGTVYWKTLHEYDEKGLIVSTNNIYPNEKQNRYYTCKHDEQGHRIENKHTQADGTIFSWDTWKYDKYGNASEMTKFKPDGSIQEIVHFPHDYDSKGNIISHYIKPKPDSEIYDYSWERDKHDNWVEKVEYYKSKPVNIYLREISYFGEEPKENLENDNQSSEKSMIMEKEKNQETENIMNIARADEKITAYPQLNFEQAKWLAEGSVADFNMLRYYIIINNDMPSTYTIPSMDIEAIALLEELKENMDAQCIYSNVMNYGDDREERLIRYTLSFPDKGYLLQAIQIQTRDESDYDVPGFIKEYHASGDYNVYTSQLSMLRPCDASGKRNKDFEEELQEYIDKCTLEKVPEKPTIYMVEASGGNYCLRSHAVNDNFEIKSLDTNYGYGFEKFHQELMARFKSETKGLILFHGEPGTGKTYYIRHLLRTMTINDKVVIYMPPNMVDYLVEPGFLTFLSNEIANFSDEGYFCALLIEDAEPLLAARQGEVRVQGVSNLLNMTDGLLNDMLDLQIICTFNVMLKELDKALLRPGRLLARKEFKRLTALDANILAQQLGVKHHFTKSATLAEVYALIKDQNTLIHDIGEKEGED